MEKYSCMSLNKASLCKCYLKTGYKKIVYDDFKYWPEMPAQHH